jgi:hypothetical protein
VANLVNLAFVVNLAFTHHSFLVVVDPRLAGGLGAAEGFEGPSNCAIWPSKWTLGLLDRFDLRSVCSAMIDRLNITSI